MTDTETQHQQSYVTQVFEIMEKAGMAVQLINATHLPDMNIKQLAKRWDMSYRTLFNHIREGSIQLVFKDEGAKGRGRETIVDGLSIQLAESNHAERIIVKMNL